MAIIFEQALSILLEKGRRPALHCLFIVRHREIIKCGNPGTIHHFTSSVFFSVFVHIQLPTYRPSPPPPRIYAQLKELRVRSMCLWWVEVQEGGRRKGLWISLYITISHWLCVLQERLSNLSHSLHQLGPVWKNQFISLYCFLPWSVPNLKKFREGDLGASPHKRDSVTRFFASCFFMNRLPASPRK